MTLKKILLILLTICLAQIINSVFSEFFLFGVFQLIETQMTEDSRGGGNSNTMASLKLISNLSIYGRPLLKTIFGASISIYFSVLLASFWIFRFQKKLGQLGKYIQSARIFSYLTVTIVLNLFLAGLLVFLDLRQKQDDDEKLRGYDQFKLDFSRISQEATDKSASDLLSGHSLFDVRHSIAVLKSIIYIGYFNAYLTVFFMVVCSALTGVFLCLDFVC